MSAPQFIFDIFLQPGDMYWGESDTRIRTILGSCVAICFWHPGLKEGGMSHSLLPMAIPGNEDAHRGEKAYYVDRAVENFLAEVRKRSAPPQEYQVKIFGGGSMFGDTKEDSIGQKNIVKTREVLKKSGFRIHTEHLGGFQGRNIIFQLWDGTVWLKHIPSSTAKNATR